MCPAMGVSRSGFNKWWRRPDSYKVEGKTHYTQKVFESYEAFDAIYGVPLYAKRFDTVEALRAGLFNYIEVFYNRKRRHSSNGGLSPAAYEENAALAA